MSGGIDQTEEKARNALFVYAAIVVGALAIALDFASVDLALPALEGQFGLDFESVQWVINGYVLAFAVLMVAGGKLADAYGRRKVFLIGMGIFALASLLGGAAWSGGAVIFFRVLQGTGAALLWPAMIGMACDAVGEGRRSVALGLIFGTCSVGNAAGPLVGGALVEGSSWRWVLWINVPMALFAILLTLWKVPRDKVGTTHPRNDYAGMVTLTSGLVALMMVIYQVQSWGWTDPRTIALEVAAVVLLGAFFIIEQKAPEPLVPPDLMKNREIQVLCFCVLIICELFFIVLLYYTQYALKFLGDDPVAAGARVVQFMLTYGAVSYFGGPLTARFGTRRLLLLGLVCGTVATGLLGYFGPGSSWLAYNGSLVLLGLSVGLVIPTVSARAIETAGAERASLVSGITFMCQLAGSAFMLAVNTAIFSIISALTMDRLLAQEGVVLTPIQQQAVEQVMAGAHTLHQMPAQTMSAVAHLSAILNQAYCEGLQVIMWVNGALVLVALLLAWRFVPKQEGKAGG